MPAGDVFDVAVVGAGPAGAATARLLALGGLRVALLERSRFDAPRIGESLPPNIQAPLRALGLWARFLALGPLPSWGTASIWGGADLQQHSHLISPYGRGWHIDRCAFDRMLADGAAVAGAALMTGVAVRRCRWDGAAWTLQADSSAEPSRTIAARLLIDATGRNAGVARGLGAVRLRLDRLVGVALGWAGIDPAERNHLLVEAMPDGWWYSAPLLNAGAMVAMLMTDADLCARGGIGVSAQWLAELDRTQATRHRLASGHAVGTPRTHCAHSQRLRRQVDPASGPWLAVGDAALAVDPISGSGVCRALAMATAAAPVIAALLERSDAPEPMLAWENDRDADCARYLDERTDYYAAEPRFPTAFWHRRRPPPAARPIPQSQAPAVRAGITSRW